MKCTKAADSPVGMRCLQQSFFCIIWQRFAARLVIALQAQDACMTAAPTFNKTSRGTQMTLVNLDTHAPTHMGIQHVLCNAYLLALDLFLVILCVLEACV